MFQSLFADLCLFGKCPMPQEPFPTTQAAGDAVIRVSPVSPHASPCPHNGEIHQRTCRPGLLLATPSLADATKSRPSPVRVVVSAWFCPVQQREELAMRGESRRGHGGRRRADGVREFAVDAAPLSPIQQSRRQTSVWFRVKISSHMSQCHGSYCSSSHSSWGSHSAASATIMTCWALA